MEVKSRITFPVLGLSHDPGGFVGNSHLIFLDLWSKSHVVSKIKSQPFTMG